MSRRLASPPRHQTRTMAGTGLCSFSRPNVTRRQAVAFLVVLTVFTVIYVSTEHIQAALCPSESEVKALAQSALEWPGFGQERGVYNFTVVTAMVDIGRGQWAHQARPYFLYLLYMQHVLKLDVNLVLYVDARAEPFVRWMRRGRERRTRIVRTKLEDLPYYRYRGRMSEIMRSSDYRRDNELYKRHRCESYIPEYDILQLSKISLLHRTIQSNPFNNTFYIWLDGGYGHGNGDVFPKNGVWNPSPRLVDTRDRVTFIKRMDLEQLAPVLDQLHKMDVNPVAGLFFSGGSTALERFHAVHERLMAEWMTKGIVDDDQTAVVHSYFKVQELFIMVPGDWYDVFKLFNAPLRP